MIVQELLNALSQIKQQKPVYDLNAFTLLVDGQPVMGMSIDIENFAISVNTTAPQDGAGESVDIDEADVEEE